jgi:hypothetical protein
MDHRRLPHSRMGPARLRFYWPRASTTIPRRHALGRHRGRPKDMNMNAQCRAQEAGASDCSKQIQLLMLETDQVPAG